MSKRLAAAGCTAVVFAVVVPAQAADPVRQQLAALKRQVAALQAKLTKADADRRLLRKRVEVREADVNALRSLVANTSDCAVTRPNGIAPPDASLSATWHGNERLAISLWTRGVVVSGDGERRSDGSVTVKYGWWRGLDGNVSIRGRRTDGNAAAIASEGPDGYDERGFQPSLITFPTPGCWEIVGRVGNESVTVRLLVVA